MQEHLLCIVFFTVFFGHAAIIYVLSTLSNEHRQQELSVPIEVELVAFSAHGGNPCMSKGGVEMLGRVSKGGVKPKSESKQAETEKKSAIVLKQSSEKHGFVEVIAQSKNVSEIKTHLARFSVESEPAIRLKTKSILVSTDTDTVDTGGDTESKVMTGVADGDGSGYGSGIDGDAESGVGAEPIGSVPESAVQYRRRPDPVYPLLSRRRHEEGSVLLRVLVGVDGRAKEVIVSRSSGFARLDTAAIQSLMAASFYPYQKNGVLSPIWTLATIHFRLTEE